MSEAQQAAERLANEWRSRGQPLEVFLEIELAPLLAAKDAKLAEAREIIAEFLKPWNDRDPNVYSRASDFLRRIENET